MQLRRSKPAMCTVPFLGRLGLSGKGWKTFYVGINENKRKWGKNSV